MKNLLVQYQGGGYDGCIWEWNFFCLDKDGKFHDIYSSGVGAITIVCTALDLIRGNGIFYVYDINCPTSLDEFAKEVNPAMVAMVMRWFFDNQNNEVYALCSKCGNKIYDPDEIFIEGDLVLCCECYSAGSCSYCGAYLDEDLVFSVEDIDKVWDIPKKIAQQVVGNYTPLCYDCCQDLLNREIGKVINERKSISS